MCIIRAIEDGVELKAAEVTLESDNDPFDSMIVTMFDRYSCVVF